MSTAPYNIPHESETTPAAKEAPVQNLTADFEAHWRAVRQQVWLWCRRTAGNEDDAQDLFQQVALRAWRGYPTFRGEASFLTWALTIARHVAAYQLGQRSVRRIHEASLEYVQANAPAVLPAIAPPTLPVSNPYWLPEAVQAARNAEDLTDNEAAVVLLRMQMPDAGWVRVGTLLNLTETSCAVLHCRAVPKLRVFLFLQRQDILGGADAIASAYNLARDAQDNPLTAEEAHVFRCLVLEKDTGYRRSGWRSTLRTACEKVIRKMGHMVP